MMNKENKDVSQQPISPEPPELEKELDKLKQERDEYLNGWKRAKADFINYQKEEMKRQEATMQFGNEYLIRELLPVLDSFLLSLSMINDEQAKKGVEMMYAQLERILSKHGLEPIHSLGMQCDPSSHEALAEVESDQPSGTIIEELEKGWKLHGKVIRPARVKIAK